jgi:O-antigen ligase
MLFRFAALYGLVFLLLTKSLTAFGGFIAGLTAYSFVLMPKGQKVRFVYLGVMGILIAVFLISEISAVIVPFANFLGRDPDSVIELTGRIPLWEECLKYVADRPFLGHGFRAFWTSETRRKDIAAAVGWRGGSAHSGYIDLLLTLGIVGLTLHTLALLMISHRAAILYRETRVPASALAASCVVIYLAFGLTETTTILYPSAITFYSLILFFLAAFASPIDLNRENSVM